MFKYLARMLKSTGRAGNGRTAGSIPPGSTPDGALYRLEPELLAQLAQLAADERKEVETLIDELLYQGVAERYAAVASLRPWDELTPREQEAAALACLGYTNDEIAGQMVISTNTVKSHVRQVLRKFNVSSKAQLREVLAGWDFHTWLQGRGLPADPFSEPDHPESS